MSVEPRIRPSHSRWTRIASAAILGAVGIAGMLVEPDLWSENPDYSARVSFGRAGWLVTCCVAAAIIDADWRMLIATWLGALAALPLVVPETLSHSPTTAGNTFWLTVSIVSMAAYSLIILGVVFGATRAIRRATSPPIARRILISFLAMAFLVSIGLLALPAGTYSGPQPAPTFPS